MHPDLDQEARLARLLRELPDEAARPYGFGEFERRALQRTRAGRSRSGGQLIAASAVIVLGIVVVTLRFDRPALLPRPQAVVEVREHTTAPAPEMQAAAVRADVMERWLASLPTEPALARVGNRAAVTGLEDRIAQVDDLLSAARAAQATPARLVTLQQERARLVGALVQVRYAETLADASR
jgi:hypothetical protein